MNRFDELTGLVGDSSAMLVGDGGRAIVCPTLGGRVFAEIGGQSVHRIALDLVKAPADDFNNYGGCNFWPAPEGGKFGWNYKGDEWYVQDGINKQPFELVKSDAGSADVAKTTALVNRAGNKLDLRMTRRVELVGAPDVLRGASAKVFAFVTKDGIEMITPATRNDALLGVWTLEQFDACDTTVSFCKVRDSKTAINFDFYDPANDRIDYYSGGFTYRTDGLSTGQIGVKVGHKTEMIGFYNLSRKLLCIRQNVTSDGLFFNIADNDQPEGPFSAADNYSIYNSGGGDRFYELETISGMRESEDGKITRSDMVSLTAFAIFDDTDSLQKFVTELIGELV